jgi:hypothetical protein
VTIGIRDKEILRKLAGQYAAIATSKEMDSKRELWRANNDLQRPRPPIQCNLFASRVSETVVDAEMVCEDDVSRYFERHLRNMLFLHGVQDDQVMEPWITVAADVIVESEGMWGFPWTVHEAQDSSSLAWVPEHGLQSMDDLKRLAGSSHRIDEASTAQRVELAQDIFGGILDVNLDRASCYGPFGGYDLSTALGYLRGIEESMLDIYENPELIHALMRFMRDAVLANFSECEKAGDWGLSNHWTWGFTYTRDLPDPKANSFGVQTHQLWKLFHAQEFAQVSPEHHEEFLLKYQLPIMKRFGLITYGCCGDLTRKIDMLRQIDNLRTIAVNSWADTRSCAEQIGGDYVLSLRPNPAAICTGFDPDAIRSGLRDDLAACGTCSVEIILKDITTLQDEPHRLIEWTRIAREEAEAFHSRRA